MRRSFIALLTAVAALLPASVLADDGTGDQGGLVVRVSGDYWLRADEAARTVIVIDGHVRVDGVVHGSLVVVRGTASVTGTVEGDATMIRSDLDLHGNATVNDVSLYNSKLTRDGSATITGTLRDTDGYFFIRPWMVVVGLLLALGMTVFVIGAGLVFSAVGGRQLQDAAASMSASPGRTIAAGLATVVGLPLLALIAAVTIVGIPIAVGILLMAIPLVGLLGYLVAGVWLGTLILRRSGEPKHPYAEATLGLLLLQVSLFVPVVGGTGFVLAVIWGTGALALMAWRATGWKRGRRQPTEAPVATPGGMPNPA